MIRHLKSHRPALACLALASLATSASAERAINATFASEVIEKHAETIVEVHLVNHMTVQMIDGPEALAEAIAQSPSQEQDFRANGVVIDPSGLVAVPGLPLNPFILFREITIPTPLGDLKVGLEGRFAEVRIVTSSGAELPAEVVFADHDTGLFLVKPLEAPESPLPALVPQSSLPHPPAFSEVICLGKMPAAFGHQPVTSRVRTTGIIASRHGLDSLTSAGSNVIGNAAFDAAGDFLGITVIPGSGDPSGPDMADMGLYLISSSTLHRLAKEHLQ